ncbi:acyl-coenzyme A thioesterase 1-like [Sceloporus undulatus]|uniref:acyl-coenzyme A thioesterase 1-like n=1 Tax=Sceloporus undulatus TaxID=8520 RepID=UPI001C4C963F|nr:acyl-coenzyme A thioesterase 1-like [Sceloporus undulatus]
MELGKPARGLPCPGLAKKGIPGSRPSLAPPSLGGGGLPAMWRRGLQAQALAACLPLRGSGSRGSATVSVSPASGLADRPARVRAEGLRPGEAVSLRGLVAASEGEDEGEPGGSLFASCGHYQADAEGRVDASREPSLGGDFEGLEPMGLFWSLAPAPTERPFRRLEPRRCRPLRVELSLHRGHLPPASLVAPGPALAQAQAERRFSLPGGVRRVRLREGALRGTLFLPREKEGNGPFPGVIDMFGDEGGLIEFRSSLLATHGFAALSLPYFNYEDLPKVMGDFHLEYFEQAARFLLHHPKVKGPGIGVVGTGKGAELASSMMTFLPEVVAAVCISGCSSITASALHYGEMTLPGLRFNMNRVTISEDGVFDIYEALDDPRDPANLQCRIPVEKAEGHFLFVVGEDDRYWKSSLYADIAIGSLRQHGKDNFKLLRYPGAGHQINPSFTPVCLVALDHILGVPILGGGERKAHAHAQEHSWGQILEFLHFHLR